MITEYTDCAELMRLITDQKIKPAAIKRYLGKQGIIFTATNDKHSQMICIQFFLAAKK